MKSTHTLTWKNTHVLLLSEGGCSGNTTELLIATSPAYNRWGAAPFIGPGWHLRCESAELSASAQTLVISHVVSLQDSDIRVYKQVYSK